MTLVEQLRAGVTTASAAETQTLAAALAAALPPDTTLALHGHLGVGKTTFVQGLARGLGIAGPVTSPTFNLYSVHRPAGANFPPAQNAPDARPVYTIPTLVHLDAYRLETAQQIEPLLLEDFLVTPWILAIEWPERIADWIPADAWHLDLGITADERHTIRLR